MGKQRQASKEKAMHEACMAVVNISITDRMETQIPDFLFLFFDRKVPHGHFSILSQFFFF